MRLLGLTLLLPLAACSAKNPLFDLATESSGADSSGDPSASSEPTTPTSTTAAATTAATTEATTAATTTPATTDTTTAGSDDGTHSLPSDTVVTTEPVTSTSEPATSSTTGSDTGMDTGAVDMPSEQCSLLMAGDQIKYVLSFNDGLQPITKCDSPTSTWTGQVAMTQDGTLAIAFSESCQLGPFEPDLILGTEWPVSAMRSYSCATATVFWDHSDDECRIGALRVRLGKKNEVEGQPVYAASLSYASLPQDFPLLPGNKRVTPCGCADMMEECCVLEGPGEYVFVLAGGVEVEAGDTTMYKGPKDKDYRFKNIQSYIDPVCQDEPEGATHLDWFTEMTSLP